MGFLGFCSENQCPTYTVYPQPEPKRSFDKALNTRLPEGSTHQPQNIPPVTAGSTTGGDPHRFSRTSAPYLSSAWLHPGVPTLVVQPNSGTPSTYNYVPPQTSAFQGTLRRNERLQIPHSMAHHPSVHGWGTTSNLPGQFVGPLPFQFSPMEQLHSNLQSVTSLQILTMHSHGHGRQISSQDGRGLFLHSHTALAPITPGERPTADQAGRTVPLPPPPNHDMVLVLKQVEPKATPATEVFHVPANTRRCKITNTGTKEAKPSHRQQQWPTVYHFPSTSVQQRDYKNTTEASQMMGILGIPQESLEVPVSQLENPSLVNANEVHATTADRLQVVDAAPDTQKDHQPPSVQPDDEGAGKADDLLLAEFMDEFRLPQEFPDIEKLMASLEPLLESIDPEQTTKGSFSKEIHSEVFPSKEPIGTGNDQTGGGQSQDDNVPTLEIQNKTQTCLCPVTTLLSLVSKQSPSEGLITNLCAPEDEDSEELGSKILDTSGTIQTVQMMKTKPPSLSKVAMTGEWNKGMSSEVVIPGGHQAKNMSTSGGRACEINARFPGNILNPKTVSVINDKARLAKMKIKGLTEAPKQNNLSNLKRPHSESSKTNIQSGVIPKKRKCLDPDPKSMKSTPRITCVVGADAPNSMAAHKCSKAKKKGERKQILLKMDPLQNIDPGGVELNILRPECFQAGDSILGSTKDQSSHQCCQEKTCGNMAAEDQRQQTIPHLGDNPSIGIPAVILDSVEGVKTDLQTEKLLAKNQCAKRKMTDQALPIKGKIKIFIPEPESFKLNEKNLSNGSRSKGLQTDKRNTQPKKAPATKVMKGKKKMEAKPSAESLKPIPKSNLALHMMESVQVFYPLGKSNVSTMPARKAPPITSSIIVSGKPQSSSASKLFPTPLPKPLASSLKETLPPPSLPRPLPSSLARPPSSLARPPSSLAKSSHLSMLVHQPVPRLESRPTLLKKAPPQPVSKPSVSYLSEMKPSFSQLPRTSVSKAQLTVVRRTSSLPSREGIAVQDKRRPSSGQSQGLKSTTVNFRPRTLPRDHSLVFRYSPPPPILPFEIAFGHWKPPPDDLEASIPITEEQRPIREMMKRQAQKEREEAAQWTSLGRVQFFVEREKEKDISIMYGYP